MKLFKPMFFASALFFLTGVGSLKLHAQDYGPHPAYLHALTDLTLMRAYLDKLSPSDRIDDNSVHAIAEIDEAIRLIKAASIDDHKDLRDHMPIDARIHPVDRFRKAREAGSAALHDINQEEDNAFANDLRRRARPHIERANQIVDHIIESVDLK